MGRLWETLPLKSKMSFVWLVYSVDGALPLLVVDDYLSPRHTIYTYLIDNH